MKTREKKEKRLALNKLVSFQRGFVKDRDWEKFHTPKNLAMALAGEAGELLEIFQWLTAKESLTLTKDKKKKLALQHELADIFYYLLRISDILEIDLEEAFWDKMKE